MEKKIFLQKGKRKGGGRSYLKLLMWSAVALIILVLLIPLGTRKKNETDTAPKPAQDKGVIFKEIPKSPGPSLEGEKQPDGIPGFIPFDKSPEAGLTPGAKTTPEVQPAGKLPAQPEKTTEVTPGTSKPDVSVESSQKPAPEKTAPPGSIASHTPSKAKAPPVKDAALVEEKPPVPGQKPEAQPSSQADAKKQVASAKPPARKPPKAPDSEGPASPMASPGADAQKPPTPGGRTLYAVQVGSFKEKANAEEMQRDLQKKGYSVQLKSRVHPKLGALFVVQLAPVEDESRASTLVEQIKREDNVKPFVVKVPAGE